MPMHVRKVHARWKKYDTFGKLKSHNNDVRNWQDDNNVPETQITAKFTVLTPSHQKYDDHYNLKVTFHVFSFVFDIVRFFMRREK